MLAKIDWTKAPCEPIAELEYSGFPHWVALAAEPNRERKAADWLKDHLNIHIYWPFYTVQRRGHSRISSAVYKAVLPGILLAPAELMEIDNRDAILDWARLRRVKLSRFITKAEVEVIREIEALLNIPQSEKTFDGAIGNPARFLDETKAAFLGEGTIIAIAPGNRITIKLKVKLIGTDVMTVSGAELEVLKPSASQ
jgi:hypothetical protein